MKKARAVEEWLSDADREAAELWPVGETRFWFLLEEIDVLALSQGIVNAQVQGMAIRCLTPIPNDEKVHDEKELARIGRASKT